MLDDVQPDIVIVKCEGIGTVEIRRPPHNYFDFDLIRRLADVFEALNDDTDCRCIILCSQGRSFCAGAKIDPETQSLAVKAREPDSINPIYAQALRMFQIQTPVVAAIQGTAIGGGLGLALVADFRVASQEARFAANFVRLGIHAGFGLSYTLPALIGRQRASLMLLTGRAIDFTTACSWGLADVLAPQAELLAVAWELAGEIAAGAPLAVRASKETLMMDTGQRIETAMMRETAEQTRLVQTQDFLEGIRAAAERAPPRFRGQ